MSSYYLNLYWDEPTTSRTYNSLLKDFTFAGSDSPKDKSYVQGDLFKKRLKDGKEEEYARIKMSFPLIEDFGFGVASSFGTQEDAMKNLNIGFINKLFDLMNLINQVGALGGTTSDSKNWMNFQVWTATEPFKMSFKLQLNTVNNPFSDVYVPAMTLTNMSNLSAVFNKDGVFQGTYRTPGVNWQNMKSVMENYKEDVKKKAETPSNKKQQTDKTTSTKDESAQQDDDIRSVISSSGKIINRMTITTPSLKLAEPSPESPNKIGNSDTEVIMLDISSLFLRTCKPTWSKHRTESGVPLYCDLDIEIESLFMSNDTMIIPKRNDVAQMRKGYTSQNRMNRSASTIFR